MTRVVAQFLLNTISFAVIRFWLVAWSAIFIFAIPSAPAIDQTSPVNVTYVWKTGDNLSKVFFRVGMGREVGPYQLYGPKGWIKRNILASGQSEDDWAAVPAGQTVKLIVPMRFARFFQVSKIEKKIHSEDITMTEEERAEELEEAKELQDAQENFPRRDGNVAKGHASKSSEQNALLEFLAKFGGFFEQKVVVIGALTLFILLGFLFNKWPQKPSEDKLTVSANVFLASLVLENEKLLEHSDLFEAMMTVGDRQKVATVYNDLGWFEQDSERLMQICEKFGSQKTDLPSLWNTKSAQHATVLRLARHSPEVLANAFKIASSVPLQRAALARVVIVMKADIPPTDFDLTLNALRPLLSIKALRKKKQVFYSDLVAALKDLESYRDKAEFVSNFHQPLPFRRAKATSSAEKKLLESLEQVTENTSNSHLSMTPTLNFSNLKAISKIEMNQELLEQIRSFGHDTFTEVLHIFVSNVPSKLAAIDDAVKSENRDDLLTAIRSLTATSIQFGADTLRDHCLALEAICSEGAVDEINTMVKKLEQSAWDTAAVLKSMTINTSAA